MNVLSVSLGLLTLFHSCFCFAQSLPLRYVQSYTWNDQIIDQYQTAEGDEVHAKRRMPKSDPVEAEPNLQNVLGRQQVFNLGLSIGGALYSDHDLQFGNRNWHPWQTSNGVISYHKAFMVELEFGVRIPTKTLSRVYIGGSLALGGSSDKENLEAEYKTATVQVPGGSTNREVFLGDRVVSPRNTSSGPFLGIWNVFAEYDFYVRPAKESVNVLSAGVYYGQRAADVVEQIYPVEVALNRDPGVQIRFRNIRDDKIFGVNRYYILGRRSLHGGYQLSVGLGVQFGPRIAVPEKFVK